MIDLITTTRGERRLSAFRKLLDSLESQTDTRFSVTVIDQSDGSEVRRLCQASLLSIRHVVARPCSLSRARNAGLEYATEGVVGFPDDDCEYAPDVIEQVYAAFQRYDCRGVVASVRDKQGGPATGYQRDGLEPGLRVTVSNAFGVANSNGIFCHWDPSLEFDERLSTGTRNACGEETDIVLECISRGESFIYEPRIRVWHPAAKTAYVPVDRVGAYARGFGACVSKAVRLRGQWPALIPLVTLIIRSCGGALLSGSTGLRRRYWARLSGVLSGFMRPW
jgi:glycosyltransferase involved in cell wall biosynthesis